MEDINDEFGQADFAITLGANDVVNPAALTKASPIN
jgi:NAD(P) transhydrogenase subunit beta